MGSGIATTLLLAGCHVVVKEVSEAALQRGMATVRANLASGAKRGRYPQEAAQAAAGRLAGAWEGLGVAGDR